MLRLEPRTASTLQGNPASEGDSEVNMQHSAGTTALMDAAGKGHEGVVELLLQRGAEINKQSNVGDTALMMAAFNGHERVV